MALVAPCCVVAQLYVVMWLQCVVFTTLDRWTNPCPASSRLHSVRLTKYGNDDGVATAANGRAKTARLIAVEVLLADPESLTEGVFESCLYLMRERGQRYTEFVWDKQLRTGRVSPTNSVYVSLEAGISGQG